MKLPQPHRNGHLSVEQAIRQRRTVRRFASDSLSTDQLSSLLYAAQGITGDGFKRAAPSGGALYPLDVYSVVGNGGVSSMASGIYHYVPRSHEIDTIRKGDYRDDMAQASWSQTWMAMAPVQLVITVEYARICGKYGQRGQRYAMIEAGHVGQNIFLQAQASGLCAGIVGAFDDDRVVELLGIHPDHRPLLIMPVGYGLVK